MKNFLKQVLARVSVSASLGLSLALSLTPALAHQHAAPASAGQPAALNIGAAFAPDGSLWVLRLDAQARLALHISHDLGQSWLAPRLLATGTDRIKSTGENPLQLLFGPNGIVLISYAQPLAKKFSGNIRLLRSTDGGAHFAAPVTLHQDRQLVSHGFSSMAFDASGALHSVWIDGRDKLAAASAAANYRGVALYRNVSRDGGASFGPDLKFADHSCECCRLAISATPEGRIAVLWRQVLQPNIRDHAFALLPDSKDSTDASDLPKPVMPQRASYDNWAIDGCPHHGPSITGAASGGYHALWFGERAGVAQVRYGKLDQDGKPSGNVQALPDARAEHASLLRSEKKLAIVWRSYDGTAMHLKVWVSVDDGDSFTLKSLARSEGESDYPRLLSKDGKIFVLWNTTEKIYVEAL